MKDLGRMFLPIIGGGGRYAVALEPYTCSSAKASRDYHPTKTGVSPKEVVAEVCEQIEKAD
jgi:hypothetical protein